MKLLTNQEANACFVGYGQDNTIHQVVRVGKRTEKNRVFRWRRVKNKPQNGSLTLGDGGNYKQKDLKIAKILREDETNLSHSTCLSRP